MCYTSIYEFHPNTTILEPIHVKFGSWVYESCQILTPLLWVMMRVREGLLSKTLETYHYEIKMVVVSSIKRDVMVCGVLKLWGRCMKGIMSFPTHLCTTPFWQLSNLPLSLYPNISMCDKRKVWLVLWETSTKLSYLWAFPSYHSSHI